MKPMKKLKISTIRRPSTENLHMIVNVIQCHSSLTNEILPFVRWGTRLFSCPFHFTSFSFLLFLYFWFCSYAIDKKKARLPNHSITKIEKQCRQNIARQVARNISQCNSALNPLDIYSLDGSRWINQSDRELNQRRRPAYRTPQKYDLFGWMR